MAGSILYKRFHREELRFSAAHRYFQPRWSEEKNAAEFGACFNPHGHGHNYLLRVEIEIDSSASASSQITALQKALWGLHEELDHRHVNFEVAEFQTGHKIPTTENLALHCAARIAKAAPKLKLSKLQLFEAADLWVEI